MQLDRAEGFLLLGMLAEAWQETEDLPPIDRVDPLVLEIRLRILTATGNWELGGQLAGVLIASAVQREKCRETVARFHYGHARALCRAGNNVSAREAIRAASDAWRDLRREMVNDKSLASALNGDDDSATEEGSSW